MENQGAPRAGGAEDVSPALQRGVSEYSKGSPAGTVQTWRIHTQTISSTASSAPRTARHLCARTNGRPLRLLRRYRQKRGLRLDRCRRNSQPCSSAFCPARFALSLTLYKSLKAAPPDGWGPFPLAGRIRSLQRQPIAGSRRQDIHPKPGSTPSQAEFRRGVHRPAPELRRCNMIPDMYLGEQQEQRPYGTLVPICHFSPR